MKKIVVLDRGWVVVGQLEKDAEWFTLTNGSVVRRWGTTEGIGELAEKGPLIETILEKIPLIKFHENKIIMIIDCFEQNWK